ncbi:MAG: hypothetical protein K8T25_03035, partial [Planctomycetia bacterium]|nr:hypothetical protein [Planctomycetia bacterium]
MFSSQKNGRKPMRMAIVAIIGVTVCLLGALAAVLFFGAWRPQFLALKVPLHASQLPTIEQITGLSLPEARCVSRGMLLKGKDAIVLLELELPADVADKTFVQLTKSCSQVPVDPQQFEGGQRVPWYHVDQPQIRARFESNDGRQFIFGKT